MRCYDGCPDSNLQALIDANKAARVKLAEKIPGARCVYFPMEEMHLCHDVNFRTIGKFGHTVVQAVESALQEAGV